MCYNNDESKPIQANVPSLKTIQSGLDAIHYLQKKANCSPAQAHSATTSREVIGDQLSRLFKLVQEYEDAETKLREVLGIQEPARTEALQPPAYTVAEMLARLNDQTSETTDRLQSVTNRLGEALGGNVKILD